MLREGKKWASALAVGAASLLIAREVVDDKKPSDDSPQHGESQGNIKDENTRPKIHASDDSANVFPPLDEEQDLKRGIAEALKERQRLLGEQHPPRLGDEYDRGEGMKTVVVGFEENGGPIYEEVDTLRPEHPTATLENFTTLKKIFSEKLGGFNLTQKDDYSYLIGSVESSSNLEPFELALRVEADGSYTVISYSNYEEQLNVNNEADLVAAILRQFEAYRIEAQIESGQISADEGQQRIKELFHYE